MILEKIKKENDIKELSEEELEILADEIREFLIQKIWVTGGHLASNLGVVELTMAVFGSAKGQTDLGCWSSVLHT